jgi:hypothetical protein
MDMHLAGTMKPFILSMLLLLPVTAILVKKSRVYRGALARDESKKKNYVPTVDKLSFSGRPIHGFLKANQLAAL